MAAELLHTPLEFSPFFLLPDEILVKQFFEHYLQDSLFVLFDVCQRFRELIKQFLPHFFLPRSFTEQAKQKKKICETIPKLTKFITLSNPQTDFSSMTTQELVWLIEHSIPLSLSKFEQILTSQPALATPPLLFAIGEAGRVDLLNSLMKKMKTFPFVFENHFQQSGPLNEKIRPGRSLKS